MPIVASSLGRFLPSLPNFNGGRMCPIHAMFLTLNSTTTMDTTFLQKNMHNLLELKICKRWRCWKTKKGNSIFGICRCVRLRAKRRRWISYFWATPIEPSGKRRWIRHPHEVIVYSYCASKRGWLDPILLLEVSSILWTWLVQNAFIKHIPMDKPCGRRSVSIARCFSLRWLLLHFTRRRMEKSGHIFHIETPWWRRCWETLLEETVSLFLLPSSVRWNGK